MTSPTFTPYSTVRALLGTLPDWTDELNAQRIRSYMVYEQIYWNVDQVFKLVQRGTSANPIYVPSGRTIVNTVNRYVATGLGFRVDDTLGTPTERLAAQGAFTALFARERFLSKFNAAKLGGIIRGDWGFHITADPGKPQGSRITINHFDPSSYFPIPHPDDPTRTVGADLIEIFTSGDDTLVRVQRYTKGPDINGLPPENESVPAGIFSWEIVYNLDDYGTFATKRPVQILSGPVPLDPAISAIPIYHVPNNETDATSWGSSELRGYERIMAAVNQGISDEELSLALDGLGMYSTDAGQPIDPATGRKTTWKIGPGSVAHMPPGSKMTRVNGVSTVAPYMDHLNFLLGQLRESSAASDAAMGKVDVQVAESGISLAMQLSPMLAKAATYDQTITDVMAQMFFDLRSWLNIYEQAGLGDLASILPTLGDKIPTNKQAEVNNILAISEQYGTVEWGLRELGKFGYVFEAADVAAALASQVATQSAAADPFATAGTGADASASTGDAGSSPTTGEGA